jgi:hypothetical protein
MGLSRKIMILVFPALLSSVYCFADGPAHGEGIKFLTFAICICIDILAPILCFISYFDRSKALNLAAWLLTILSIPASLTATYILVNFQTLLPCFCLITLLAKMDKRVNGSIAITALKYIVILFTLLSASQVLIDNYLINFYPVDTLFMFVLVIFQILLAVSGFMLLKRLRKNGAETKGFIPPVKWTILIGLSAYALHIAYLFGYSYVRGSDILADDFYVVLRSPATFEYLAGIAIISLIVFAVNSIKPTAPVKK